MNGWRANIGSKVLVLLQEASAISKGHAIKRMIFIQLDVSF
jgi:hypothetical protein